MKSRVLLAVVAGAVAVSFSAPVLADPPKPPTTITNGEDVKKKPDGFKPDTPRVPDGPTQPKTDVPGPNEDPAPKPDGWTPDSPGTPD